jgi:hypothetical protein
MKNPLTQFVFALMILFFTFDLSSQTSHTVVLRVNTANIEKPNLEPFCSFDGQQPNVSDVDFTILVSSGDTIRWKGVSTSSNADVVNIESINYRGGQNVLGQNVINGVNGQVMAIVRDAEVGQEEKYAISFTVFNNGEKRNGTYVIDPKLKIH